MFNGCLFIQRGRLCTELCWKVREFPSIILSLISPARHSYIFIRHQSWRRDLDLPRPQSCCVRGGGNRHKNEYSKVHALLARFIDREEADFQDLATSESTNTFAFGRPNFWRLLLLDHHSTVMSEFEGDEFFLSHGCYTYWPMLPLRRLLLFFYLLLIIEIHSFVFRVHLESS